jgi:hypothetical protein
MKKEIVTNLTRTLQSSRFWGGQVFYPVFKNGATGSTPSLFRWFFDILNFLIHKVSTFLFLNACFSFIFKLFKIFYFFLNVFFHLFSNFSIFFFFFFIQWCF